MPSCLTPRDAEAAECEYKASAGRRCAAGPGFRMNRRISKKFAAAFRSSSGTGDEEPLRVPGGSGASGTAGVPGSATMFATPAKTEPPRPPGFTGVSDTAAVPATPPAAGPSPAPGGTGASGALIHIDLTRQRLELRIGGEACRSWPVSTAANGPGERQGSECTPRGRHVVRARIGAGAPSGAVFVARRPTGERYTPALGAAHPERDWILTRILWLSGAEPGKNRLGGVDTMRRYIYIHGCPDDTDITVPGSRGCIRMRNEDVTDLFDRVEAGTQVVIEE